LEGVGTGAIGPKGYCVRGKVVWGCRPREYWQGVKMPGYPAMDEYMGKTGWELSVTASSTIIIIMVRELNVPFWFVFISYVLSFIHVGIYCNKLQYGCHVSGAYRGSS
jgi:hypothetical protein